MRRVHLLAQARRGLQHQRPHRGRDRRGQGGAGRDHPRPVAAGAASRSLRINCATLSPTLFEAELFGHERAAFTDAREAKPGLLETAEGGTVLLDEIGELPLPLQAKLLRVIETHEVMRVGARQAAHRRRALPGGDQPRPRGRGRARRVPAGPLLPAERHLAADPAAARARRRDRAARAVVRRDRREGRGAAGPEDRRRRRSSCC